MVATEAYFFGRPNAARDYFSLVRWRTRPVLVCVFLILNVY